MVQYKYRKKRKGDDGMARAKRTKWDKNLASVIQAQNAAIVRINELREAGWNVSDEVMRRVTAPLAKRYTAEQARKAKQMFSLNRINFAATKQIGPVKIRKTQRFDDPYMAAIDKLLTKPEGALKLSEAIAKDVKHTLDPLKGSPSRSKAAFWVEMLSDLQNQSGVQLIPKKKKSELIKDAYMIDVSPAKLKQAIEKSAWSFREVGEGVYKYMPDIRGDKQEQIARSKQTLRKQLHASPRSIEALFEFFEYSIWWNHLRDKQRHAVSEQIVSTLSSYNGTVEAIDFAELDRRLLQGGDPVEVVEQYVRELIGDEL